MKPKTEFGKLFSFVCVRIISELIEGNKQIPFACTILTILANTHSDSKARIVQTKGICLFPSINSLIIRTQTKLNNLPNSVLGFILDSSQSHLFFLRKRNATI